jgi:hypothetical protein
VVRTAKAIQTHTILDIEAMGRDPKTGIQYGMNYLDLDDEGQAVVKASPSLPLEPIKQLVITVSEHKNYKQPSYLNAEMGPRRWGESEHLEEF